MRLDREQHRHNRFEPQAAARRKPAVVGDTVEPTGMKAGRDEGRKDPSSLHAFMPQCLLIAFCAVAVIVARGAHADGPSFVLIPEAIVAPSGELVHDRAIVVENGRIARIVDRARYDDENDPRFVLRRPGAIVSPGLIDALSTLGVHGQNMENVDPIDPVLTVADAFDPGDPALRIAMEAGVTAAMIVPGANNLVGGAAAMIRTQVAREPGRASQDGASGEIHRAEGPLMFSIGTAALRADRAPTSRGGALSMLRNAFAQARNNQHHPRLNSVIAGNHPFIVVAGGGEDVTSACRLFEGYGLAPVIAHSSDLLEVMEDVVEGEQPVIVGPFGLTTSAVTLLAPGRVSAENIPVAFAGRAPAGNVHALRLTASLAVRHGMDPAAARRGLSAVAAEIAGVSGELGTIEPGRRADMVVFSGDPLNMGSRVLEVYVDGRRLFAVRPGADEAWAADWIDDSDSTFDPGDGGDDDDDS